MSDKATMSTPSNRDTKKNLDTFHPFLRFFSSSETPRESRPDITGSDSMIEGCFGFDLTVPRFRHHPHTIQDWIVCNPSAYAKDVVLWTACWETRVYVSEQYKKLEKRMNSSSQSLNEFVSCRSSRNQEDYEFKVSPKQDLFCIQPQSTKFSEHIMPCYRLPGHMGLTKLMNTAIEYDQEWLDTREPEGTVPYYENSPRGYFIRSLWAVAEGRMHNGFQFWVIDRSIRRRNKSRSNITPFGEESDTEEEERSEPLVFQSLDRRYVEVRGLEECDWDALKQTTVFHFLHWLQIRAGFGTNWIMRNRSPRDQDKPPLKFRHLEEIVKVLCEEKL